MLLRILFPIIGILWATVYYAELLSTPETARYTVQPVYFFLLFLFGLICLKELRAFRRRGGKFVENTGRQTRNLLAPMCCLTIFGLFIAAISFIGFAFSSVVFLLCFFLYHHPRIYAKNFLIALLFTTIICFVFERFFGVFLPKGVWGG